MDESNSWREPSISPAAYFFTICGFTAVRKLFTKYSYYLMFMLCLPICLLAHPILELWLGVVPEYTVIFLQLILIQSLFQVFDTSFYTALYAKGRLKENALISPTFGLVRFPIIYLLFKMGCSPVALSWASLITYAILGLIVKPILIVRIAEYRWRDILQVFKSCLLVTVAALPVPVYCSYCLDTTELMYDICILFITFISIAISIYTIGIDKATKQKAISFIYNKWKK